MDGGSTFALDHLARFVEMALVVVLACSKSLRGFDPCLDLAAPGIQATTCYGDARRTP